MNFDRIEIHAPFTAEQVKYLSMAQCSDRFHPYTCMDNRGNCGSPHDQDLLVSEAGYVCPCGRYKQTVSWQHTVDLGKRMEQYPEYYN